MYRLLPAIVLSAGLQCAFAASTVPTPVADAPEAIVQAQLEVPTDAVAGPRVHTSTHASKSVAKEHDEEQRPAAMLLAALVLMTGIALRRWGMGQQ